MFETEIAKIGPRAAVVCGSITLITAAVLWAHDLKATDSVAETKTWPISNGTITAHESRPGSSILTYDYDVDGKKYTSHRIWYDQTKDNLNFALDEKKYPVGQSVQVHYNQKEPQIAVLNTESENLLIGNQGQFFKLMFLGIALTTGILVRRRFWRMNQSQNPAQFRALK
jgi:hypothetical protein